MASHRYDLEGIGSTVELGNGGARIRDNGGIVEARNNADDALARMKAASPTEEDDLVTLKYLRTRADVRVTGQIDGGSPPAAGTPGRVFICTTTGGSYTLKYLYYDNGVTWDEVIPGEGLVVKVTDDLNGGTDEYDADHLYQWDEDGGTWVDIGPVPAETGIMKTAFVTLDYTDTGANLLKNVPLGAAVRRIAINVTQVFNGTTPIAEVGDSVDPDRFMPSGKNKLTKVGLYETTHLYIYGAATDVNATITIGGSPSTGQMVVAIDYALP